MRENIMRRQRDMPHAGASGFQHTWGPAGDLLKKVFADLAGGAAKFDRGSTEVFSCSLSSPLDLMVLASHDPRFPVGVHNYTPSSPLCR